MLATDPKEQARALVYSQVLGSGATSKHPVPARVRRQPRIGSREASENLQPVTSAQLIDHQPELHARTEFLYPTRRRRPRCHARALDQNGLKGFGGPKEA